MREDMEYKGGCYCGKVRYQATGDPLLQGQCHCRECQYISGGAANMLLALPADGFSYSEGNAKEFRRSDLESPVTREFCANCGTHLLSRAPGLPGAVIIKVGTLDDPSQFAGPQVAIFLEDAQPFQVVPDGVATFDRTPSG